MPSFLVLALIAVLAALGLARVSVARVGHIDAWYSVLGQIVAGSFAIAGLWQLARGAPG